VSLLLDFSSAARRGCADNYTRKEFFSNQPFSIVNLLRGFERNARPFLYDINVGKKGG
jgi:hypothetical protein